MRRYSSKAHARYSASKRLICTAVFMLVCNPALSQAQDERHPQRGFQPGNSYAFSEIESISMSGGNLNLKVPLASLPAGRGGSPGFQLSLTYNSKLYDTHIEEITSPTGDRENLTYLNPNPLSGGWRYTLPAGYTMRIVHRGDEEPFPPCLASTGPHLYSKNAYLYKMQIIYPDGSTHEFRPTGHVDYHNDGYFNIYANGRISTVGFSSSGTTASCTYSQSPATTGQMIYYSTDGSYTRLVIQHAESGVTGWTLYFPDGSRVSGASPEQPQRMYDRNNNYVDLLDITYNGHPAEKIVDQMGRYIIIEKDSTNNQDYIHMQGVGGQPLRWTVRWKSNFVNKMYVTIAEGQQRGNSYQTSLQLGSRVVDQIVLPSQAGGLNYEFGYNGTDQDLPTLSPGWGELNSVKLPSGAKATYAYALDGVSASGSAMFPTWKNVLNNKPERKELTYRQEHDLTSPVSNSPCDPQLEACTMESWVYEGGGLRNGEYPGITTVTGPDGGVLQELKGDDPYGPAFNRAVKTIRPNGTMIEHNWAQNRSSGMTGQVVNPYLKTEFTSIKDAAGNYVKTAIKDYSYDQNGNVTVVREYDWVSYTDILRDVTGRPTWIPAHTPDKLKRVTNNKYYNPTPDASEFATSPNAYHQASALQLRNLIESSEVSDGSQVISRTEFSYDNPNATGNLTEQRNWDSTKGAILPPQSNGIRLNSTNSVSVSNQYDPLVLGKITQTTGAGGATTEYSYDAINGVPNLYPTETRMAVGTTVQRITRQQYDFWTGLVTRATDADNNVTTSTSYDDLGRPTLVRIAEGKPEETRSATEYSDVYRRVVTRSDLNTIGDSQLVAIQHYDQLGRVRLTRQLEDAATPSATVEADETIGIKVQTRHLYSGANSYRLTSNPYRAATAAQSSTEAGRGWTRSHLDQASRLVDTQTFSGTALPSPWGDNANATGRVAMSYDAEFTTVTDQAEKVRRSMINGLGQLVRVDEPNTSGALGAPNAPTQPTCYKYDTQSNLTEVKQGDWQNGQCVGGQPARTFMYSSLARLLSASNPESGTITYTYYDEGNLRTRTDARLITTSYSYDKLGRALTRTYSDGTPGVTYDYDDPLVAYSRGRLTSTSSSVSTYRYTEYDALGRTKASSQTTDGQPYTMGYTYDRAGNLLRETYPSGRNVVAEYDSTGRIAGMKNGATGVYYVGVLASDTANRTQYAAHGAITAMKLGNGLWEHASFNSRLQPTQIGLGTAASNSSILQLDYNYGTTLNNGNVLSQTITIPGLTLSQAYGYDQLNRLETANESGGASWKQKFKYDRFGNRRMDDSPTHTTPGLVGPNPVLSETNNRIVAQAGEQYFYDDAGSLTRGREGQTYGFDAENKMISFNGGASQGGASYSYDGDGKRVKKVVGTLATIFVYDVLGRLIAEYSSVSPEANGTRYLTSDHLGSPRVVTDSSGAVKARHDYLPFGEELGEGTGGRTTGQGYVVDKVRQKFTSYERDTETGLDFAQARYHSPTQGRFTSPDPLNASGKAAEPQSWNRYTYCGNNPLIYVDPTGLEWVKRDLGNKTYEYSWLVGDELTAAVAGGNYSLVEFDSDGVFSFNRVDDNGNSLGVYELHANGRAGYQGQELDQPEMRQLASLSDIFEIFYLTQQVNDIARMSAPRTPVNAAGARANFYSVYSTQRISGGSRTAHRRSANQNFLFDLKTNPDLNNMFSLATSTNVITHMESGSRGLLNPPAFIWHHNKTYPTSMELLWRGDHTNPSNQWLLHPDPGGSGGYARHYGKVKSN